MLFKDTSYQPLFLDDDKVVSVSDVVEAQYRYDDEANKLHQLRELRPVKGPKLSSYFVW